MLAGSVGSGSCCWLAVLLRPDGCMAASLKELTIFGPERIGVFACVARVHTSPSLHAPISRYDDKQSSACSAPSHLHAIKLLWWGKYY